MKKTKADGKMSSVSDISKYNDAIEWGAGVAGQRLPTEYYKRIDKFMGEYKKEHAEAKKEGNMDEREADPINASLFTLMQVSSGRDELTSLGIFACNVANDDSVDLHIFHRIASY